MHLTVNKIWFIICQAVMSAARKSEAGERGQRVMGHGGESHFMLRHLGVLKVMAEQEPEERSQKAARGRGF